MLNCTCSLVFFIYLILEFFIYLILELPTKFTASNVEKLKYTLFRKLNYYVMGSATHGLTHTETKRHNNINVGPN